MASEDSLYSEFKLNSSLLFNAGFSLTEINEMLPFERATYIQLWNQHMEEKEKEKNKNKNNGLNF